MRGSQHERQWAYRSLAALERAGAPLSPSPPNASEPSEETGRRVVAIVLPDLLCEIAGAGLRVPKNGPTKKRRRRTKSVRVPKVPPLGVVMVEQSPTGAQAEDATEPDATLILDAVNEQARRYGVRPGQTIAEACALVSRLVVREVSREEIHHTLGRVAEAALAFGATVSIEAPDTVWVDITGSAHLVGGEQSLAAELASRVRSLGHVVRLAVSNGPHTSRAFARWSGPRVPRSKEEKARGIDDPSVVVVPSQETASRLSGLSVMALPIDRERVSWLMRLGVMNIGDLVRLPRAAVASRLGEQAGRVLELCEGRDASPLVAYQPPATPFEETTWDDPLTGSQPLLFVLRGLVAKMSARLEGRGEAAQALDLVILYDRSIARLNAARPEHRLRFDLATPLYREEELRRVLASRLERTRLSAPTVGLRLEAPAITRALGLQLDLSRGASGLGSPEALPVLLTELASDIGQERIGVLSVVGTHRPEAKSALVPALEDLDLSSPHKKRSVKKAKPRFEVPSHERAPTRMLPEPQLLDASLRPGATVSIEHRMYDIKRVTFERRLDFVEWWSKQPLSRDYYRVWLEGAESGFEALVYVDRRTGARYLQAVCD